MAVDRALKKGKNVLKKNVVRRNIGSIVLPHLQLAL